MNAAWKDNEQLCYVIKCLLLYALIRVTAINSMFHLEDALLLVRKLPPLPAVPVPAVVGASSCTTGDTVQVGRGRPCW